MIASTFAMPSLPPARPRRAGLRGISACRAALVRRLRPGLRDQGQAGHSPRRRDRHRPLPEGRRRAHAAGEHGEADDRWRWSSTRSATAASTSIRNSWSARRPGGRAARRPAARPCSPSSARASASRTSSAASSSSPPTTAASSSPRAWPAAQEAFADMMNEEARAPRPRQFAFHQRDRLADPDQYVSARDLAQARRLHHPRLPRILQDLLASRSSPGTRSGSATAIRCSR